MSASRLIFVVCLVTCFLNYSASEEITAEPGHDVILQCQGPRDADIELLEWIKPDMESDDYVFFIRDGQRYEDEQHPSFHGRVKLRDPTMKDGDASLILKNVTAKDAGTYECHVGKRGSQRSKRSAPKHISNVTLMVGHTEHTDITAKSGHRVILPCRGFSNTNVTAVDWIRPDLQKAGYVFMFRDGRSVPDNQHPYYKDHVELKDKQMKDGDVSLILKEGTTSDSGTYRCFINQGRTRNTRSVINLTVEPGHREEGGDEEGGD